MKFGIPLLEFMDNRDFYVVATLKYEFEQLPDSEKESLTALGDCLK